jgi:hypothetical protein
MKLMILALATVAAATAALAAPSSPVATSAPPRGTGLPSGQCFRSHDIRNHTVVDRNTLLMNVNGRATYRVTVNGCLAGATQSDPIVTRNPPGSDVICKPIDLDLGISKNGFESRCIVESIVRMSPEEVAALPRKLKP